MWKGSISFGLVTIPIKLYTATEARDIRFNLLHAECRSPIQYRKWCPNCDREIEGSEIVKGYEYDRGQYVLMEEGELEAIPVAAARTIDIVDFVRLEEIDPVYFEKTYYIEPGDGGAKAYALLREAMQRTGRIAIARVVIRSKESLAAIRVFRDGVLAMETMHYPDEVRSPAGLAGITQPELRPQELEMATNLIASLTGEFRPEKFGNEYRDAVLELIQAKVAGQDVAQPPVPHERGRVVDLMDALRASIRMAEETRGEAVPAPGPGPAVVPMGPPGVPGFGPGPVPGLPPAPGLPAVPVGPATAPSPGGDPDRGPGPVRP